MLEFPYSNTELEDLVGETWEDIPFLDGLCRISNYGRVKRLARTMQTSDGKVVRFNEKIIRSYLTKQHNKSVNDDALHLAASLNVENRRYKFSVARLVYYCFIKKFDLDDHNLVVYAIDGNGKNTASTNLCLTDLSGKALRIFERGRLIKNVETTIEEYLRTNKIKSSKHYCKQVSQYTYDGKYIATFPSVRTASLISGVSEHGILSVLKRRQLRSGGFSWTYGKKKEVDVKAIRSKNLQRRNKIVGTPVTQYRLNGKRIASFVTIAEAARKSKTRSSDIHAVLKGHQASAGGFLWKRGTHKRNINTKKLLTGNKLRAHKRMKKVDKFSAAGKKIASFESVKQAAANAHVTPSYISTAIKKGLLIRGARWMISATAQSGRG